MESDPIFWGMVLCALAGGILAGRAWQQWATNAIRRQWPERWNLSARPLFNSHERALFRELRAALPGHVVLAKVSLLRFCQSAETGDAHAWFERLHPITVSLLVCKSNGLVVAAIDIDNKGEGKVSRSQKLKEAVLEACRIRYVRCAPGHWPRSDLLASWALGPALHDGGHAHATRPAPINELADAGDQLARKLKERRAERASRFGDSSFAQDSFFAHDSRFDGLDTTTPGEFDDTPRPSA
jgi:Protein of unknown function (DUF2726)